MTIIQLGIDEYFTYKGVISPRPRPPQLVRATVQAQNMASISPLCKAEKIVSKCKNLSQIFVFLTLDPVFESYPRRVVKFIRTFRY